MAFKFADRVKETSMSTGVDSLTLDGALTGFRRFSDVCSIGDQVYYAVHTVDSYGVPNGAWECGIGTYSATNTLTRTKILSSSNGGAAVTFVSSLKHVFITLLAASFADFGEVLFATRNYYVRTDGADTNNGLANTSGGAFATIQRALDAAAAISRSTGYAININIANGTYADPVVAPKPLSADAVIMIMGNATTPANVVISLEETEDDAFNFTSGGYYYMSGVAIDAPLGNCIVAGGGTTLSLGPVRFLSAGASHIKIVERGLVLANGALAIAGGAQQHILATEQSAFRGYGTSYTLTGTPAFSDAFISASEGAIVRCESASFSGSATGKRYSVSGCSFLNTYGVTLPGSIAGTTATGGQVA